MKLLDKVQWRPVATFKTRVTLPVTPIYCAITCATSPTACEFAFLIDNLRRMPCAVHEYLPVNKLPNFWIMDFQTQHCQLFAPLAIFLLSIETPMRKSVGKTYMFDATSMSSSSLGLCTSFDQRSKTLGKTKDCQCWNNKGHGIRNTQMGNTGVAWQPRTMSLHRTMYL